MTNNISIPNLFALYLIHRLGLYDVTSTAMYKFDGKIYRSGKACDGMVEDLV